ncbi:MAG: hypothetical protein QS721_11720 [Candidatus Endonucleobacter sp. (ex Gigantidas childressi)]|nr:hypothetical protein [Candidatus Endonucleobacter sp. (ex Gigantidas childressi)]
MLGSLQSYFCSVSFCCKYVKSVCLLLMLTCSCNVSATQSDTLPAEQLHQQSTEKPTKKTGCTVRLMGR